MDRITNKELDHRVRQLSELYGYRFRLSHHLGKPQLVVETHGGGMDPVTDMSLSKNELGEQILSLIEGVRIARGDVPPSWLHGDRLLLGRRPSRRSRK